MYISTCSDGAAAVSPPQLALSAALARLRLGVQMWAVLRCGGTVGCRRWLALNAAFCRQTCACSYIPAAHDNAHSHRTCTHHPSTISRVAHSSRYSRHICPSLASALVAPQRLGLRPLFLFLPPSSMSTAPPPPPALPSSPISFASASLISVEALTTSLSPSYAARLSSILDSPSLPLSFSSSSSSLLSSPSPSLPLSASRGLRPHRSSLGHAPSSHRLRLSSHAQRALAKQADLLHSPAGSEVSLAPSLPASPLPCSPASSSTSSSLLLSADQENRHPNLGQLSAGLAALSLRAAGSSHALHKSGPSSLQPLQPQHPPSLSPGLAELAELSSARSSSRAGAAPSTPLQRFPQPIKRLSFASHTPRSARSTAKPTSSNSSALPHSTTAVPSTASTASAASTPSSASSAALVDAPHMLPAPPSSSPPAAAATAATSLGSRPSPQLHAAASSSARGGSSHVRKMR